MKITLICLCYLFILNISEVEAVMQKSNSNEKNQKIEAPYGRWKSPITPAMTSRSDKSNRSTDILVKDGKIYWTELRTAEKGRTVLVCRSPDGSVNDVVPQGFDVRTKVHEYGGGAYTEHQGVVYFINNKDQILYSVRPGELPKPLTSGSIRLANFQGCAHGLVAIGEEHTSKGVDNFLALVSTDSGQIIRLDEGHDFYASPALSPDGRRLAWITWDHPNMPWDATQLWTADFVEGKLENKKCVAEGEAIFQPQWSPKGILYFISDRSGWWNIYRLAGDQTENVYPMKAEFGLPHWRFGMSTWGFTGKNEQILCAYLENGFGKLSLLDPTSQKFKIMDLPYSDFSQISIGDGFAVMMMGSPTVPRRVMRLDLKSLEALPVDSSDKFDISSEYFSVPQHIEFPSTNGRKAFGYYYEPKNKDYKGPEGQLPPLLVLSHGGPTGWADPVFNLKVQYWTSRGLAVIDVNYGGSAGFGREYRDSLKGQWGIIDVQDCENAALYLAEKGLVDRHKMAIRGGSAGGYTTLAALAFTKTFSAGASYYGVGDLAALAKDTHKFESLYLDSLIGPYPACEKLYQERAPLAHADKISCPVIFFQGADDKVVPKNQAEMMYEALRSKGIPTKLIIYENEEHGFRQKEHIEDSLIKELDFYLEVFSSK